MRRNPISLAGAAISTSSAFFFIFFLLADWLGLATNPYLGIVFFLVVPAAFVFGLLLIPAGVVVERRRRDKGLDPHAWPTLNFNDRRTRRIAVAVLSLTLVNLLIVSLAAYRGVAFMDSRAFCGQVCHTVMAPEYTAAIVAPHAQVECVQCHIGSRPSSFVLAKLNGLHQVVAVVGDSYARPVPSPVRNMRPANETCENCHWPEKIHGDKLRVMREYANDESSTETVTTLTVHVGGGSERLGVANGIHWHMNVANRIEYVATDASRQTIPYVRVEDAQGHVREYRAAGVNEDQLAKGERRRMDCIDCHNRAAHPFSASAERAVDAAIATGELPRSLPFARREAVAVLKGDNSGSAPSAERIAQELTGFYTTHYPDIARNRASEVDRLITSARRIYARNVFPAMNVTWGTHPSNLGHTDANGCFRCHDDQHKTADGRVIRQDCDLCHSMPE